MRVREFEAMIERRSGFCFLYLAAHGEKGKACDNCPLHKNGACSVYYEDNSLFTQVRNARAKMERLTKQLWQKNRKSNREPNQIKGRCEMKRELSEQALGAKNIRKELKAKFPGVKFSVCSESFAGGNAIEVDWIDGPTRAEVERITSKYKHGTFDGMTDSYTYKPDRAESAERGGAKYVQARRLYSAETMEKTGRELCRKQNIEYEGDGTRYLYGQQDCERLGTHVCGELSKTSFKTN